MTHDGGDAPEDRGGQHGKAAHGKRRPRIMVATAVAYAKEASLEDGSIGWKEDEKRTTLRSGDHRAGSAGACGRHVWK